MKKFNLLLAVLTLLNLAILLTNTATVAHAGGPATPYWTETPAASSLTQFTPATAGTNGFYSGPDGWYVSNNGGPLVKVGSGAGAVRFSDLTGQLTPAQLPSTSLCTFTGTIGTSNKITLSACQ